MAMITELANHFRDTDTVDLTEVLATIDYVCSGPRQMFLDGSIVLTKAEAREHRERY
jgi:hypothetical protein